ncbi:7835_t:CDS:2, partial [Dentiscutata erythropus]
MKGYWSGHTGFDNKNETTNSSSQDNENAIQSSISSNDETTSNLRQDDENEIQPSTSSNDETTSNP